MSLSHNNESRIKKAERIVVSVAKGYVQCFGLAVLLIGMLRFIAEDYSHESILWILFFISAWIWMQDIDARDPR